MPSSKTPNSHTYHYTAESDTVTESDFYQRIECILNEQFKLIVREQLARWKRDSQRREQQIDLDFPRRQRNWRKRLGVG